MTAPRERAQVGTYTKKDGTRVKGYKKPNVAAAQPEVVSPRELDSLTYTKPARRDPTVNPSYPLGWVPDYRGPRPKDPAEARRLVAELNRRGTKPMGARAGKEAPQGKARR